MRSSGTGSIACTMLAGALLLGCARRAVPQRAEPVDRLAPNEVVPGLPMAFDCPLPRGSSLSGPYDNAIYAIVPLQPQQLLDVLLRRATQSRRADSKDAIVVADVRMPGSANDHTLRLELRPRGVASTFLTVYRVVPPPPVADVGNDELMRRAGLSPSGRRLDPDGRLPPQ